MPSLTSRLAGRDSWQIQEEKPKHFYLVKIKIQMFDLELFYEGLASLERLHERPFLGHTWPNQIAGIQFRKRQKSLLEIWY